MNKAHFNVDRNIKHLLSYPQYSYSLSEVNLRKIPHKKKLAIVSIKSQSTITRNVLNNLPALKCLITRTVGTDHIDLIACKERAILVKNIPDYGSYNIAEHALALLLSGARNIVQANHEVHDGHFDYSNFLGVLLQGKTVGVMGTGRIGLELIKLLKAFKVEIIAYDIIQNIQAAKEFSFSYVPLNVLLKKSDFISIHIPLLPSTHHLIGEKEMKVMKEGVVLVNTSRGEIINTKSLIEYIKKCKAVCLDVVEEEKNFPRNNPLLAYNNVIITPHIAFYTDDSIKTIAEKTEKYMKEFFKINY